MKSRQIIVTSSNSPFTFPISHREGPTGLGVTPNSATYTVEFSLTPQNEGLTVNTFPIPDMTAATTAEQVQLLPVTAIIITLDSGTSVSVDIAQSDV